MTLPRYNLNRKHRVTVLLDDQERQTLIDLMAARRQTASDVLRAALQSYRDTNPQQETAPER